MAAQAQQAKVLRIGIIQDGKIVQERLIKQGENVLVGEASSNTFVLPKTSLPKAAFPLFVAKGGKYHLSFTEAMKGKVSTDGAVVGLDKLRGDPEIANQAGVWRLPLTEKDRGKVAIDNVTVLFQFVPPPPAQAAKPLDRMDFRPKWFDEDDPAYFGFLALFAALATIFAIGISLAPEPPEQTFNKDSRFAQAVFKEKEEKEKKDRELEEQKPDEDLNPDRKVAKKKAEKKPDRSKAAERKPKKAQNKKQAQARENQKARLREENKLFDVQFLGTTGESSGGTTDSAMDGEEDVLKKLGEVGAGDVEVAGSGGTRTGDVSTEDINVDGDDLGTGDAGATTGGDVGFDPNSISVGSESSGADTFLDAGTKQDIDDVVRSYQAQLRQCYERELRANPNLSGRVVMRWSVTNGRATGVSIVSNTTNNSALGDCMIKNVRRWRFPRELAGEVDAWPFVFRKQ